jgi:alkylated DNA nucleotide flippase Atl1
VLFNHVAGNAEQGGDLTVGQAMQTAEDKNFLTPWRQVLNQGGHSVKHLPIRRQTFRIR